MLVTTYQHDYIPPYTKRYDFLKYSKGGDVAAGERKQEECQCIEETKIEPPKAVLDLCDGVEWSGIAPMGRLVDPRIIPTKFSPEQIDGMSEESGDCFKEQPNRFLKILRTAYPDLYERLKQMPKNELSRRLERQRLFTTYQIDFCNMNEYPEGVYESLKQEEETSKINASKLLQRAGPCSEFRANVMDEISRDNDAHNAGGDPCEKAYKPFKISFADSSRFVSSGNNSHWRSTPFTKRAYFSEYMDTINKNGCIITKNNLHNHSKCADGKHCHHQLVHTCVNLK